ncbi:MAG: cupin domain-containing protein [Chloroflexi bacterium]|nr:cupin domain-containing protein [Chloroflexota bacterium]
MDITSVQSIAELDQYLNERGLGGSWRRWGTNAPTSAGGQRADPLIWKRSEYHEALQRAGELVSMDQTGALAGQMAGRKQISKLGFGVQILMPGEVAEAHRHTQAGLRFIIRGNLQAAMVVEGEAFPMADGDLITTPWWAWHDYRNVGDAPVFWLDALDLHFARLSHMFREVYAQPTQPLAKPPGHAADTWGRLRPSWITSPLPTPPYRYRWADTVAALDALKENEDDPDPLDGYVVTYSHPISHGPTIPTLSAAVQLLPPHFATEAHRHNCTTSYFVVQGEGTTLVDGERVAWATGDIFQVPPWRLHQHENRLGEDAILYRVTDEPTMRAWGFYREGSD